VLFGAGIKTVIGVPFTKINPSPGKQIKLNNYYHEVFRILKVKNIKNLQKLPIFPLFLRFFCGLT
jgi:hypothetical protein